MQLLLVGRIDVASRPAHDTRSISESMRREIMLQRQTGVAQPIPVVLIYLRWRFWPKHPKTITARSIIKLWISFQS